VPIDVTFDQIVAARHRIASGINLTPCTESDALSDRYGARIFTKLEYLQRTGSFKERGARNALLLLPPDARERGVIAASAGNHALALAYHGRDLKVPVTVVMPRFAPLVKQERCRRMGATLELYGDNIAEAKDRADELAAEHQLTYVHGFDDPHVIAGAGTVGLEILEQVPDVDIVICPIGGAGLIAGLGRAMKTIKPGVRIVGVEPDHAPSYQAALAAGEPVRSVVTPTLGDGLAVPTVGENAFAIARTVVDETVLVDEAAIALAILRLLEGEKGVVEGAGASPLAALIRGKVEDISGKTVVLVLCGGNIDPAVLGRVIEYGLVADGRIARFRTVISDRPGGLARLTTLIAESGASVKQITHERAFASPDVSTVDVDCIIETRNREHVRSLLERLEEEGFRCVAAE
jgi:threonine dehydratase